MSGFGGKLHLMNSANDDDDDVNDDDDDFFDEVNGHKFLC